VERAVPGTVGSGGDVTWYRAKVLRRKRQRPPRTVLLRNRTISATWLEVRTLRVPMTLPAHHDDGERLNDCVTTAPRHYRPSSDDDAGRRMARFAIHA